MRCEGERKAAQPGGLGMSPQINLCPGGRVGRTTFDVLEEVEDD